MIPRTQNVILLIQKCFEDGWDNSPALPILADALEEDGYSDLNVLIKLRTGWISEDTFLPVIAPGILAGFDWKSVFEYAKSPKNLPESSTSTNSFARWDVETIFGTCDGENEGRNWIIYGQLKDKRYFFLTAGCDYTGWG